MSVVWQIIGLVSNDLCGHLHILDFEKGDVVVEVSAKEMLKMRGEVAALALHQPEMMGLRDFTMYSQMGPIQFTPNKDLKPGEVVIKYKRHLVGMGIG